MEYDYTKCECLQCGRKILVERGLMGVTHTVGIYATCLDCVMKKGLTEKFKEQNPDAAKDITEWYDSSEQTKTEVEES